MRTIRRSSSLIDRLPDPVRDFLSRRAAEIVGLVLLALTAAVAISLATWSVDDPSLNNATRGAVQNLLGRPGAMVADLAMQLIGLGVIAMLLPPLLWSLRLIRVHLFDRSALKLALWVAGIVATAAVASALPATPRWPLPTGMGGVIGDALLHGTRNLVGISGTALGGLVAFVYAGIAILAVTAAAGCAAYAGIPLTHRDHAQTVTFATGHLKDGTINLDWPALARPKQTAVFYMGIGGIGEICRQMIAHGLPPTHPAAVVQHGTTPRQRVLTADLATLPAQVKAAGITSPALIIVGTVVNLHAKLAWFEAAQVAETSNG
ncbi:MAG: DNA translocase FtsK 4TM domain-containing protein [Bosea sp.]|nr:DNA translocase FtsK 4TM domain-containing protein [Bosea sp. (in: a-proteobacteria)]